MIKQDELIRNAFAEETPLPQVVIDKANEAYASIYASKDEKKKNVISIDTKKTAGKISRAAVIILACFLLAGSTAVAATLILRHERLKNMTEEEIDILYDIAQSSGEIPFKMSREYTEDEAERYSDLSKAYEQSERFPEGALPIIGSGEEYTGSGLCLKITKSGEEHVLYLPKRSLTDEELLEIIEYLDKEIYALEAHNTLAENKEGKWESRLNAMTDEEVDYIYRAACSSRLPTGGAFVQGDRQSSNPADFIGNRYDTLLSKYESESIYPEKVMDTIEWPEDFTGATVVICAYDSNIILPNRELTDEEILEIIDFKKKEQYVLSRLEEEIRIGYRADYPDTLFIEDYIEELEPKTFCETHNSAEIVDLSEAKIGCSVYFGSYEQDSIPGNGTEAISWMVLDRDENNVVTLLSEKVLDSCIYADTKSPVDWKDSLLRGFLNEYFYKKAFSESEKALIQDTVCEETTDKVYLLSLAEACSYFGVSLGDTLDKRDTYDYDDYCYYCLENYDSRLFANPTESAKANGIEPWSQEQNDAFISFGNADISKTIGKSAWWLRDNAHSVNFMGAFGVEEYPDTTSVGIRPVIRVKINQ